MLNAKDILRKFISLSGYKFVIQFYEVKRYYVWPYVIRAPMEYILKRESYFFIIYYYLMKNKHVTRTCF